MTFYDGDLERSELRVIFETHYLRMLRAVHLGFSAVLSDVLSRARDLDPATRQRLMDNFRLDDAAARRIMVEASHRLVGISDTTEQAIMAEIRAGQAAGEDFLTIGDRIEHLFTVTWNGRAATTSRTETQHAQAMSAVDRYRNSGGLVRTMTIRDGGTTDSDAFCNARNGQVVPVESRVDLAHPNCLPAGSLVLTPDGAVPLAAMTRQFQGEVVVLRTAGDQKLTCTPNHPVLTNHGWVPAGMLSKGCYVLGGSWAEWSKRLGPDNQQVPTRIEQITRALRESGGGPTIRVPSTTVDFHGDGLEGDINVVRADGFSEDWLQSHIGEPVSQQPISRRDMRLGSFFPARSQRQIVYGPCDAAHGGMRRERLSDALLRGEPCLSKTCRLTHRTRQPVVPHVLSNARFIESQLQGDHVNAQLLFDIERPQRGEARVATSSRIETTVAEVSMQCGSADANAGRDLFDCLARLIAPVQVVEVQRRKFRDHVYNVQTAQGWYIAEGIVTHNCTMAVIPNVEV